MLSVVAESRCCSPVNGRATWRRCIVGVQCMAERRDGGALLESNVWQSEVAEVHCWSPVYGRATWRRCIVGVQCMAERGGGGALLECSVWQTDGAEVVMRTVYSSSRERRRR